MNSLSLIEQNHSTYTVYNSIQEQIATRENITMSELLIARIRNNHPTITSFNLTDPDGYSREQLVSLIEALERNNTIESFRFHQHILTRNNLDLATMRRFIACARRLGKTLKATASCNLFALVLGPQTLVHLKFSNLILTDRASVLQFARVLKGCSKLRTFKIRAHMKRDQRRHRLLDMVLLALSKCKDLQKVRINARTTALVSIFALRTFLQGATSVQKLCLVNLHLGEGHISEILENLQLSVHSLSLGYLRHYPSASDVVWERFFTTNEHLKKLSVICEGANHIIQKLNRALDQSANTTLNHVTFKTIENGVSAITIVNPATEFRLLLNRKGRRHWINSPNIPPNLLPLILVRGKGEDPSFLYHWLQRSVPILLIADEDGRRRNSIARPRMSSR